MIYSKSNDQILKELDSCVYGHRSAKKALINLVNRSKMRYHQLFKAGMSKHDAVSNVNCLLIGDSGTGKTHLVRTLTSICDLPLLCVDATQLAPTSASEGFSAEKLIKNIKRFAFEEVENKPHLYENKDAVLNQMIVFVDEIDKLANSFDSSKSWNRHVQANFLAMFENNTELENASFIFAGAFANMDKRHKAERKDFGFVHGKKDAAKDFDVEAEVIKYGLIPELIGRIQSIEVLDELKEKDFKAILNKMILPKIRHQLKHFNAENFKLSKVQEADIIKRAISSEMGVRVLTKELQKLTQEIEFNYEWNKVAPQLEYYNEDEFSEEEQRAIDILAVLLEEGDKK